MEDQSRNQETKTKRKRAAWPEAEGPQVKIKEIAPTREQMEYQISEWQKNFETLKNEVLKVNSKRRIMETENKELKEKLKETQDNEAFLCSELQKAREENASYEKTVYALEIQCSEYEVAGKKLEEILRQMESKEDELIMPIMEEQKSSMTRCLNLINNWRERNMGTSTNTSAAPEDEPRGGEPMVSSTNTSDTG